MIDLIWLITKKCRFKLDLPLVKIKGSINAVFHNKSVAYCYDIFKGEEDYC